MDTTVLIDTATATVAVASSGIEWKPMIHEAIKALLTPEVMVYVAAAIAGAVATVRARVSSKKQAAMDAVVYAFGHVEKAFDLLAKDKKAKYNKEIEFAKMFKAAYERNTGKKVDAKLLTTAISQAARLALEKKLSGVR